MSNTFFEVTKDNSIVSLILIALIVLTAFADNLTTQVIISLGGFEYNPIISYIFNGPPNLIGLTILRISSILFAIIIVKLVKCWLKNKGPDGKKWISHCTNLTLWVATIFWTIVLINNSIFFLK